MRCGERRTLFPFNVTDRELKAVVGKLWCLSCVLAYTGELEEDLREQIETLKGRVADGC
jgi:hypothetical protein